jgi:integrase
MFECRTFITVKEIGEVLGVSESKSYGIVRDLNKELADKGYMVIPGRVSRKYFEERFYGVVNETEEKEVQHASGIGIKRQASGTASFITLTGQVKKVKKMKRGFETKKEAQDWERHFKLEKASSLDMTFGDFYRRYEEDVKPKVRENTWNSKVWVIEKKILPYFKDLVMRDITPRDVLAWQNEMRKLESKDGEKFKGTYLRKMQAELSAIFNHAVKYYELPKNPAVIAGPLGQHHADEMLFWTKEEYMRFIPEVANKTYSYMAFELLYWCGIRIGELMALTPADFDFDKNKLSITKSYQRISGRDVITKPKTPKSVRMISMPENVALEMRDFLDSIYGIEPGDRIFVISKSYLHQRWIGV